MSRCRYVPIGLFPRFLLSIVNWCSVTWNSQRPKFFRNFARLSIGDNSDFSLVLSCTMTIIRVLIIPEKPSQSDIWVNGDKRTLHTRLREFLTRSLGRLKNDHHWLAGMEFQLCLRCSCFRVRDTKCVSHHVQKCSNDSCSHFIPLDAVNRCYWLKLDKQDTVVKADSTWVGYETVQVRITIMTNRRVFWSVQKLRVLIGSLAVCTNYGPQSGNLEYFSFMRRAVFERDFHLELKK